jgi:hypothetical protein
VHTLQDSRLAQDWRIRMLRLEGDWVGAAAARGEDWSLLVQSLDAPRACSGQ